MPTFLDEIVASTRIRVAECRQFADLADLRRRADLHVPRGFRRSLQRSTPAIIAELKHASPSKGRIRGSFHVSAIAREYEEAGAAALSVLTEEKHFLGCLSYLREASAASNLPCLRKDFILDEFQLLEAKAHGADAVLLIAAALGDEDLRSLYAGARDLGLDVLCEVHDRQELDRAIAAGFDLIGVNSRDLRTFEVDVQRAVDLAGFIPDEVLKVAESGIHTADDILRLRDAGFGAFLIGEAFMRADSPGKALSQLLRGVTEARR